MSLELSNEAKIMLTKFAKMSQAIERVRKLHQLVKCDDCSHCPDACKECFTDYPCPTIIALDGEQK